MNELGVPSPPKELASKSSVGIRIVEDATVGQADAGQNLIGGTERTTSGSRAGLEAVGQVADVVCLVQDGVCQLDVVGIVKPVVTRHYRISENDSVCSDESGCCVTFARFGALRDALVRRATRDCHEGGGVALMDAPIALKLKAIG